ncbi:MAG: Rha family transcriptional regulator [Candidatus Accumulibacter sp.]|jgi:Rha family phage regulatory protein|nr:Rha family transcriptional regulator [Accumulibacter sp.]
MNQPDLFPETLLVTRDGDGRITTTTLQVAEHFHRRHTEVLRAVENLFRQRNFASAEEFRQLNFASANYLDRQQKPRQMYRMTEEGFALLAMGFTGEQALLWKIDFLNAFKEMRRELTALKDRESAALYAIRPRWKPIVLHPAYSRAALISLTGHTSLASITACRRKMRAVGLLERRALQ